MPAAFTMEVIGDAGAVPEPVADFAAVLTEHGLADWRDRPPRAPGVLRAGARCVRRRAHRRTAPYGNILLVKGVDQAGTSRDGAMVVVFGSINADLVARVARLPRAGRDAGRRRVRRPCPAARAPTRRSRRGARARTSRWSAPSAATRSRRRRSRGCARPASTWRGVAHGRRADRRRADPRRRGRRERDHRGAGANALARADAVPDALLVAARTLLLQFEVPRRAKSTRWRARARARGARVVLNAAPARPLPAALLRRVDVLVVNENEARCLREQPGCRRRRAAFAAAWPAASAAAVVVTLGAAGPSPRRTAMHATSPPPRVEVVDTTGAGDAFAGALAAALDRGRLAGSALARRRVARGLACAARTPGAQRAWPPPRRTARHST